MSVFKFKYVEVVKKPAKEGEVVFREEVSHLSKKGVDQRFVELEKIFNSKKYLHQFRATQTEHMTRRLEE